MPTHLNYDRPYTLEIEFRGLGMMGLSATSDPRCFSDAIAYLVDTEDLEWQEKYGLPAHRPQLSFLARDFRRGETGDEMPASISDSADEVIKIDLIDEEREGVDVDFGLVGAPQGTDFAAERMPPGVGIVPVSSRCLEWQPRCADYDIEIDDWLSGPQNTISRIVFPGGRLESRDIVRNGDRPEWPEIWRFSHGEEAHEDDPRKALANSLVLVRQLPADALVSLKAGGLDIKLAAHPGETLRIAVTNLPLTVPLEGPDSESEAIHHMKWLAKLSADPAKTLGHMRIPRAEPPFITIKGRICPFGVDILAIYETEQG